MSSSTSHPIVVASVPWLYKESVSPNRLTESEIIDTFTENRIVKR